MTLGVDYPWAHPSPAALQAAGVGFAMRYLSHDDSKDLHRGEADALAAVGIWCGAIWETTEAPALAGRAAGAADAREALAQAQACGKPDGRPIYFAVDTDTTWDQVAPYFQGVRDVLPLAEVGAYGGLRIIQGAAASGLVSWFWQAEAWSGGDWDPHAHIRQAGTITIGGVTCDQNTAMNSDYGQWMPGQTPEEDYMDSARAEAWFGQLNAEIWGLKNDMAAAAQRDAAQTAAITQLAAAVAVGHGLDPTQLLADVQQAVEAALAKVKFTVTTQPPAAPTT
ncbi:glycoside hydrolase domain-containing protein [Kitasatospora sp. NPDC059571]|uniref:glycoside hydrolase domain-containing protein n=1 Tax=Kitasatospora sp. NPDC059571 TaxID=3346871 RepID=UPI0036A3261F